MSRGARRSPRQDRSRFTVDTLLEAAAQLFGRDGLATTTNHIAARAGTSIGTLYQYFPDKQAILHALARRHVTEAATRLGAVLDEVRAAEPPFEPALRRVLDVVVDLHRDRPGLHALMHRMALREAGELAVMHPSRIISRTNSPTTSAAAVAVAPTRRRPPACWCTRSMRRCTG